jgi:hypothetical protein
MSVTINGDGTITSTDGTVDFGDDNLATTGTIPAAQLTGALPAVSGAALTALPATLPAASGANLTALNATNLATGTVATARLGTGTASSSTFLRGDGSWQAAGGGAFELVATAVASNSANLTITGLDTTFENYLCIIDRIVPASAGSKGRFRIGDSSGIKNAANDYKWHTSTVNSATGTNTYAGDTSASSDFIQFMDAPNNTGSGASFAHGGSATFTLSGGFDGNAGHKCFVYGNCVTINTGFELIGGHFGGVSRNVYTVTQVQFSMSTGNITSGRMTVWGIKHT